MDIQSARRALLGSGAALAVVLVGSAAIPASAQGIDDTDLYAYIYEGSCAAAAALGDRFERIGELDDPFLGLATDGPDIDLFEGADPADALGLPPNGTILEEDADYPVTLERLTGDPHVILVREGDNPAGPIVACGDVAGEATDGVLRIDLAEVDGSGYSGVAVLAPERDALGADETEVTVQVRAADAATPAP